MAAPDRDLIERFRRDLEAALPPDVPPGATVALAVSGGPDSMAMLALAHAALPGRCHAATVDHRLREAAAAEAAMVAAHCAALGVPHRTLAPAAPIAGASIQARAREARYALLLAWAGEIGAGALLTAHHLDDQAETFLMRAARGSGVPGLAAIRERMPGAAPAPVVRPLLGWRRAELRRAAQAAQTPFVDDPSNADEAFDRTRFRRLLEANPWLDAIGLARAAAHAGEADRALQACAGLLAADRLRIGATEAVVDIGGLPRELRRRLARAALEAADRIGGGAADWASVNIEPLLDALEAGRGASQGPVTARAKGQAWHFRPAPPRRSH